MDTCLRPDHLPLHGDSHSNPGELAPPGSLSRGGRTDAFEAAACRGVVAPLTLHQIRERGSDADFGFNATPSVLGSESTLNRRYEVVPECPARIELGTQTTKCWELGVDGLEPFGLHRDLLYGNRTV